MADRAVTLLRRRPPSPTLARALTIRGQRLLYAGRPAHAETAAREALTIIGDTPGLARGNARHILAQALTRLGRYDEAIPVGEDALGDYRGLPSSDRLTGRICAAMLTVSDSLNLAGRPREALVCAEELATRLDAMSMLQLPWVVHVWWREKCHRTGLLSKAGRFDEALKVGMDVIGVVNLAVRFDPNLRSTRALLLAYLAYCHGGLGQHDEAAASAARSIADYRTLGDGFNAGTAWALEIQAEQLTALGRLQEADAAQAEACSLYAVLEAADPDAFRARLYGTLKVRDEALWASGDREAAWSFLEGAMPDMRRFAEAEPDRYRPILASWLKALAARSTLVDRTDGLRYADEAIAIVRELALSDAEHEPLLAEHLNFRALILRRLGRPEPSVASALEAAEIYRPLTRSDPARHEEDLLTSLDAASRSLYELGRDTEAVTTASETIEILRRRGDGPENRSKLATALHLLALTLSGLHDHAEAVEALTECIDLRGRLGEAANDKPAAELSAAIARALRQRSFDLDAIWRHEEAVRDITEALGIFRRLASSDPDTYAAEVERTERQAASHERP
jgi:hypothetical protein